MNTRRSLALLTSLSLLLAACNGAKTPANTTAASIELSGQSDVKLNDPTTFTAIVKAADGTVLTSKKVAWTSSDGEVAAVDANGVVTARHFGAATLTAAVDGVKKTVDVRTYGLEVFAGVRDSGSDTALFLRYRTKTGKNPVNSSLSFTVAGPNGWYGGQSVTFEPFTSRYFNQSEGSGTHWFELGFTRTGEVPAVLGNYTVTFNVDGEEWVSTASITSLSNSSKVPTNIVAQYDGSNVTSSWDNVVPKGSYQAEVLGSDPRPYLKEPKASIQTGPLTAGQTYYVGIHALTLDITAPVTTALAGPFDVRYNTGSFQP